MWPFCLSLLQQNADAAELSLGALAGYRGYFDEVDGLMLQEHLFEENLRAELDTAIVRRSVAAWNVGFALDHNLTFGSGERSRVLRYEYETDLQLWGDSALPVRLFASRQVSGVDQSLYPGSQSRSSTYGYEAAIRPSGLPRIESLGLFQRRESEDAYSYDDLRTSLINGQLLHNDNRLLAVAGVERRQTSNAATDDRRDMQEGEAFLEYRIDGDTSVVARTRARRYDSLVSGAPYALDTLSSEAAVNTRRGDDLAGTLFYRINDQAGPDHRWGDANVGTRLTWYPAETLSGTLSAGIGDAWAADSSTSGHFIGQYTNLAADRTVLGPRGGSQIYGQTGVATVADDEGGGVQGGGLTGAVLRRTIGPVQLAGGGNVGRQLDSSARAQSYASWGWLAELASNPFGGVQLQLQATESVIDQRLLEVGDSDRLRVTGLFAVRPEIQLDAVYGLSIYRDSLDEERSSGFGHAVSLRAVPSERLQLLALYRYDRTDSSALAAFSTHQVEGTVLYRTPIVTTSARVTHARSTGLLAPAERTLVWVELAREFRWDI